MTEQTYDQSIQGKRMEKSWGHHTCVEAGDGMNGTSRWLVEMVRGHSSVHKHLEASNRFKVVVGTIVVKEFSDDGVLKNLYTLGAGDKHTVKAGVLHQMLFCGEHAILWEVYRSTKCGYAPCSKDIIRMEKP